MVKYKSIRTVRIGKFLRDEYSSQNNVYFLYFALFILF